MAARLIRWAQLYTPVDVVRATTLIGLDIEYVHLRGSAAGMLIEESPRRWLIIVNSRYEVEEQRFTIAHELGHWTLHRPWVRRQHTTQHIHNRVLEHEANRFAYSLLMPAEEVEEEIRHRSGCSVEFFQHRYQVTRAVAANGLRRLGLDLWRP